MVSILHGDDGDSQLYSLVGLRSLALFTMVRVLQRPEKYLHIFNNVQKYFRWTFPRKIIFRITYFDCEMCEPPMGGTSKNGP